MPRRRSHGLTFGTIAGGPIAVVLVVALSGCPNTNPDNGCQVRRQLVFPSTSELALLPQVQIEPLGSGYVILGSDGATARWVTIDAAGTFGTEQALTLPADTLGASFALAGVDAPGDRVIVGVLTPAANGADADL